MTLQQIEFRERILQSRLATLEAAYLNEVGPIREELQRLESERCRLMQNEVAVGL